MAVVSYNLICSPVFECGRHCKIFVIFLVCFGNALSEIVNFKESFELLAPLLYKSVF